MNKIRLLLRAGTSMGVGVVTLLLLLGPGRAHAKISVVATVADLGAILREVGGEEIKLDVICKGTQDAHHIEAKPSFIVTASRADLLVSIGLGLEVGWLPPILKGSRNSKIDVGQKGHLEVGALVDPIEIPHGEISRAEGDVHPEGNPHVTLDPIRSGKLALKIAERLAQLDTANASLFMERANKFNLRMTAKTKEWQTRIENSKVKKVVTYHKTLDYFFDRFKIENVARLEPKPGVPPTGPHVLSVLKLVKDQQIPLILVENYFDEKVALRIQQDSPGTKVASVPVAVEGIPSIKTLDDLYENLVKTIEGK